MAVAPGTHLGQYEILALFGIGGMGEVYRAKDTRLDRLAIARSTATNDIVLVQASQAVIADV